MMLFTPPVLSQDLIPSITLIIPAEKASAVTYLPVGGDNLTIIASRFNTSPQRLFNKNTDIVDPDVILVGQKLVIPLADEVLKDRPMPVAIPTPRVQTPKTIPPSSASTKKEFSNDYQPGQCTSWVASHRYVPAGWGDASNWKYAASAAGWTVSAKPVAGAIGWTYGHVVFVVSVGNGVVRISEQNWDWNSGIRTITVPSSKYTYLY